MAMHGRLSRVRHDDSGLFAGIPQDFSVVRYHSLAVTGSLGPDGRVTAWTDDGVVMGIEHRRRPLWGVQFHPESVATQHGHRIVQNFYDRLGHRGRPRSRRARSALARSGRPCAQPAQDTGPKLLVRSIAGEPALELVFERLFGDANHAFWLDSADAPTRLAQCSYLGTSAGADRCVLEYDVDRQSRHHASRRAEHDRVRIDLRRARPRDRRSRRCEPPAASPRGLLGGFVGYLGYECKADCGSTNVHRSDVPDAVMMLANRIVAVDHVAHRTDLLALAREDDADAERWLDEAERVVRECPRRAACARRSTSASARGGDAGPVTFSCGRGREQYLADIARCQAALAAGESYEVCLTDQISSSASPEPFALYRILRRTNPAPFAAYLKLGELAVLSSSPERFLSVDRDRQVQARPIKGTTSRSNDPVEDEALRARAARTTRRHTPST